MAGRHSPEHFLTQRNLFIRPTGSRDSSPYTSGEKWLETFVSRMDNLWTPAGLRHTSSVALELC